MNSIFNNNKNSIYLNFNGCSYYYKTNIFCIIYILFFFSFKQKKSTNNVSIFKFKKIHYIIN